jgi:hypothetical protein
VAVGGRRKSTEHNGGLLTGAKEKYAMTVKCTPNKDAITTSNLSVRSGFLMKKNEQGQFQRRFVCMVPHMFLYYFENEMSEAPRGVIDMELLHNISSEPNNVIKLATEDEDHWRSFYFQDHDLQTVTEWMTSFIRDRYNAVCEERDAYRTMQSELTGEFNTHTTLAKSTELQRQLLEQESEKYRYSYQEAYNYIQIALVELGISDDEMSRLNDVNKIGTELKHRIAELKEMFQSRMDENNNRFDIELLEHQNLIAELKAKLESEASERRNIESQLFKEKKDSEQQMKDCELQFGNLQINLQLAIASKDDVEAKANVLNDQKRLLVKEVKHLRKKLEETQTLLEEMKSMNSLLADSAEALRKEVEELQKFRAEHSIDHSAHPDAIAPNASGSMSMMERLFSDHHSLLHRVHTQRQPDDEEITRRVSIATDDGDDRHSWDLPTPALKELGSLHGSNLAEGIAGDATPMQSPQQSESTLQPKRHRSSLAILSKVMFGDTNSSNTTAHVGQPAGLPAQHSATGISSTGSSALGAASSTTNSSGHGMPGNSYLGKSLLSSVFGSVVGSGITATVPATVPPSASNESLTSDKTTAENSGESSASFFSPFIEEDEQMSLQRNSSTSSSTVPMKLICLRCKGTVEGPKFSTCKCSVPALSPDDLVDHGIGSIDSHVASGSSHSSSSLTFSALTGMFSKGSSAIAKATSSSVEGFINYTNNPLGDTSQNTVASSSASSLHKKAATNESSHAVTSEVLVSTVNTADSSKEIVSELQADEDIAASSVDESTIEAATDQETAGDIARQDEIAAAPVANDHSNLSEEIDETTL